MPWDTWYDLEIRELSDLSDLTKERLAEAEQAQVFSPEAEEEEQATPEPVQTPSG